MGPSVWLAQASPVTWLAVIVFILPGIYIIITALRDRSWIQLGLGLAFVGPFIFLLGYRIIGAAMLIFGIALAGAVFLRNREGREEFQLE